MGQGDFGFGAEPFEDVPDPRFFFPSAHAEPLCRGILSAAHQAAGVVLLIGAAGSGKSMLLRRVEAELRQRGATVALYIACRPDLAFDDIIEACCDGLGVPGKGESGEERRRVLADRILARSARGVVTAVLVDGAERLSGEVLTKLIELSQFGKKGKKLLQVVVAGRPELERNPAYRALQGKAKGLVFRCHLAPLQDDEVGSFIEHRLAVAGCEGDVRFSPEAAECVAELTRGNPRAIVATCRQARVLVRRRHAAEVSRDIVEEAMEVRAPAPVMLDKLAGASRQFRRGRVAGARLWLALSLALAAGGGIVAVELAKDAGPSDAPAGAVSRPLPPR